MTENELPDEQLLAELRDLFSRAEPVPGWVVETAKASYDLRQLDVELALLTWDSDVDAPAVAVRGSADLLDAPDQARALSFEAGDLAVEVEIGPAASGRPLIGQLVPPQSATVEVHQLVRAPGGEAPVTPTDAVVVAADPQGRFAVPELAAGLVRISCRRPGRQVVATNWIRID